MTIYSGTRYEKQNFAKLVWCGKLFITITTIDKNLNIFPNDDSRETNIIKIFRT